MVLIKKQTGKGALGMPFGIQLRAFPGAKKRCKKTGGAGDWFGFNHGPSGVPRRGPWGSLVGSPGGPRRPARERFAAPSGTACETQV